MGDCTKRYGSRQIWVTSESDDVLDDYWMAVTAATIPALYRENVENTESRPGRGQALGFKGAQAALDWELTAYLPNFTDDLADNDGFAPYRDILWAAGSEVGGSQSLGMGYVARFASGSACGRRLNIVSLDRDGRSLEILTGAVVSQIVFNLSTTEQPTIVFSGSASKKFELDAFNLTAAPTGTTITTDAARSSFNFAFDSSGGGISLIAPSGETTTITEISNGQIKINAFQTAPTTGAGEYRIKLPIPSTLPNLPRVSTSDWAGPNGSSHPVTAATITIETGIKYGDITVSSPAPDEILSGQFKVTGSITGFLTNDFKSLMVKQYDQGNQIDNIKIGEFSIYWGNSRGTELPALDLSSVDEAATGEFSFQVEALPDTSAPQYLDFCIGEY